MWCHEILPKLVKVATVLIDPKMPQKKPVHIFLNCGTTRLLKLYRIQFRAINRSLSATNAPNLAEASHWRADFNGYKNHIKWKITRQSCPKPRRLSPLNLCHCTTTRSAIEHRVRYGQHFCIRILTNKFSCVKLSGPRNLRRQNYQSAILWSWSSEVRILGDRLCVSTPYQGRFWLSIWRGSI